MGRICNQENEQYIENISIEEYEKNNNLDNISRWLLGEISNDTDQELRELQISKITTKIEKISRTLEKEKKHQLISEPYMIKRYIETSGSNHVFKLIFTAQIFNVTSDSAEPRGIDAIFFCSQCQKIHIFEIKFTSKGPSQILGDLKEQLRKRIQNLSTLNNTVWTLLNNSINLNDAIKKDLFEFKYFSDEQKKQHLVLSGGIVSYTHANFQQSKINFNLFYTVIEGNGGYE